MSDSAALLALDHIRKLAWQDGSRAERLIAGLTRGYGYGCAVFRELAPASSAGIVGVLVEALRAQDEGRPELAADLWCMAEIHVRALCADLHADAELSVSPVPDDAAGIEEA